MIFSKLENRSRDCVFRDILLTDIVCIDFFSVKTAARRVPGYSTERQTVCSTFTMCNNSRSTHSGIFYSGTSYVVIFYKLENWSRDCVFRDILLKDIVCSDFFLCWHIGRVTAYSGIFYSGTLYVRMEHVGPTCSLLGRPTA